MMDTPHSKSSISDIASVPYSPPVTVQSVSSFFVLMPIETLGEAHSLGWKVTTRCAWGEPRGNGDHPRMHPPLSVRHADARLDQGPRLSPLPAGKRPTVPTLRLAPRRRSVRTSKFAQDGDLINIFWLALKSPHLTHLVPRRYLRLRRTSLSD
jgi:hypothetical protein